MIWFRKPKAAVAEIAKRSTETSDGALLAEAHALCGNPAFREAIWRHHRHRRNGSALGELSTRVHASDQMLRHSLRHFADPNLALTQYFGVALQQHAALHQLLQLVFDGAHDVGVLDFACGFGRSLRFLPQATNRSCIWASDIQREAVDFVVGEFGVQGLHSTYEPERFQPSERFDFIWVASLFSHLPAALFERWLRRLLSLLTDRGVLCFSVHDERLLPADKVMPAEGLYYASTSEIEELDSRAYGTSFVSEAYVRNACRAAAAQPTPSVFRLPRALANHQDVYVVQNRHGRDFTRLSSFRKGPWGWVDQCRISEDGMLVISGWAASLDDGQLDEVQVRIDGELHHCPCNVARDDVRAMLGDDRLRTAGWELVRPLEGRNAFVEVSAPWRDEVALLYAGPLSRLRPTGRSTSN